MRKHACVEKVQDRLFVEKFSEFTDEVAILAKERSEETVKLLVSE